MLRCESFETQKLHTNRDRLYLIADMISMLIIDEKHSFLRQYLSSLNLESVMCCFAPNIVSGPLCQNKGGVCTNSAAVKVDK